MKNIYISKVNCKKLFGKPRKRAVKVIKKDLIEKYLETVKQQSECKLTLVCMPMYTLKNKYYSHSCKIPNNYKSVNIRGFFLIGYGNKFSLRIRVHYARAKLFFLNHRVKEMPTFSNFSYSQFSKVVQVQKLSSKGFAITNIERHLETFFEMKEFAQ